jgi:NAD(P)H-dependent flavin oxidoreductase YrpB (nitropropane dioxygenase family)
MHYVGFVELASAVSNAGGLGIITGLTQKIYGWFTEGFDTRDLKDARWLFESLQ